MPLLGAVTLWSWGRVLGDPAGAVEATLLALLLAGVGCAVAAMAPRPSWEVLGGTFGSVLTALAIPPGPARGATLMATLGIALGVAAFRGMALVLPVRGEAAVVGRLLPILVPLALGLQLLARGGLLLSLPGFPRTAMVLLALPLLSALAVSELLRVAGAARALGAAALLFSLGGGLWPGNVLALGVLALGAPFVVRTAPAASRSLPRALALGPVIGVLAFVSPRLGALSLAAGLALLVLIPRRGGALRTGVVAVAGTLVVAVALAAGYPWFRPRPLATLALLPLRLFEHGQTSLFSTGPPERLSEEHSLWVHDLAAEAPVSRVRIDSSLAQAMELPAGTAVATLRLTAADGREQRFALRVGAETGEWAARRPGFEAPAPAPLVSWVDGDRFFGARYRAEWTLEPPFVVRRVEIERRPDLPPAVELVVFRLELVP